MIEVIGTKDPKVIPEKSWIEVGFDPEEVFVYITAFNSNNRIMDSRSIMITDDTVYTRNNIIRSTKRMMDKFSIDVDRIMVNGKLEMVSAYIPSTELLEVRA